MVARQGFEPRYAAPEAAVLPLNERAKNGVKHGLARPEAGRHWVREGRLKQQTALIIIRGLVRMVKRPRAARPKSAAVDPSCLSELFGGKLAIAASAGDRLDIGQSGRPRCHRGHP